MDLDLLYPEVADLRARARRRLPHFAWEYLDSATGDEGTAHRNTAALDAVTLNTAILGGEVTPDLTTRLMGRDQALPFGIAPVGMSGLIWRDAEPILAQLAGESGIPYSLSTVATRTPEDLAPHIGNQGWFQLYPPGDGDIRRDLLKRAKDSGFHTLILTVDVPVASRRERQRRARLSNPMRITPRVLAQVAMRPAWALAMATNGIPKLATLEKYARVDANLPSTAHIGYLLRTAPDWDYLDAVRTEWDGKLVVKGVTRADDASACEQAGVDAVWVSNHAGRQFAAARASLDFLPEVRAATSLPVIFDSGVRSGTDILRAIALGADFVMLGKAFHYGLAAFGARGAAHVVHILREQLIADMGGLC
ncbi:MAG: alpha-hydroxy-acid oxidizing protein [Rhodobacteraceae bacterium]|nr:alpha-hydroxy-acid oxidizing protein [Paracoccaceae bacterium]